MRKVANGDAVSMFAQMGWVWIVFNPDLTRLHMSYILQVQETNKSVARELVR